MFKSQAQRMCMCALALAFALIALFHPSPGTLSGTGTMPPTSTENIKSIYPASTSEGILGAKVQHEGLGVAQINDSTSSRLWTSPIADLDTMTTSTEPTFAAGAHAAALIEHRWRSEAQSAMHIYIVDKTGTGHRAVALT